MRPEVRAEGESDIPMTFPLTRAGKNSVMFDWEGREFLVDGKVRGDLSEDESTLFGFLLMDPYTVHTSAELYQLFYPNDREQKTRKDNAELIQAKICRLKKKLKNVEESLSGIIQTMRGSGYSYNPHPSLKDGGPIRIRT